MTATLRKGFDFGIKFLKNEKLCYTKKQSAQKCGNFSKS